MLDGGGFGCDGADVAQKLADVVGVAAGAAAGAVAAVGAAVRTGSRRSSGVEDSGVELIVVAPGGLLDVAGAG